jgi:hypothetical protein
VEVDQLERRGDPVDRVLDRRDVPGVQVLREADRDLGLDLRRDVLLRVNTTPSWKTMSSMIVP